MLAPVAERAGQNSCHFTGRGAENLPAVLPRAITVFLCLEILAFFTQKFAPKRRCPQGHGWPADLNSTVYIPNLRRAFYRNGQILIIRVLGQCDVLFGRGGQDTGGVIEFEVDIIGQRLALRQHNGGAVIGIELCRPGFVIYQVFVFVVILVVPRNLGAVGGASLDAQHQVDGCCI